MSRSRAVAVIVTTASLRLTTRCSTSAWWAVGAASTVCATTTTGTRTCSSTASTWSPSGPPKMPYSCCTTAMSKVFSAAAAERCDRGLSVRRCPTTSVGSLPGGLSTTRTTPTRSPDSGVPMLRIIARVKVARPHWVGG